MSAEAKCSVRSNTVVLLMDLTRFNNNSEGRKLECELSALKCIAERLLSLALLQKF